MSLKRQVATAITTLAALGATGALAAPAHAATHTSGTVFYATSTVVMVEDGIGLISTYPVDEQTLYTGVDPAALEGEFVYLTVDDTGVLDLVSDTDPTTTTGPGREGRGKALGHIKGKAHGKALGHTR